jgi:peptidyl-prolyl cis-trans isomerase D
MKPLIAVFVVAFILTIVAGLFGSLGQLTGGNYAFKLNGKKVEILKIEKAFQMGVDNFKQQYGESADVEELKLLIFNNLVEQELLLQNAKKLKVKVTDKDIDDQIQQIEGTSSTRIYKNYFEKRNRRKSNFR